MDGPPPPPMLYMFVYVARYQVYLLKIPEK